MKKVEKKNSKWILLISGSVLAVAAIVLGAWAIFSQGKIQEVPTEDAYGYVNPDETKAETDEGMVIDGVLDEKQYENNNWLYLHNSEGGNNVDIAMTSYYGEKGMYFVYDVTESVPIYVNLNRNSYMNSCIEMYFAPSSVTSLKQNSYFEVDMLPTGDMVFKKSNGKGGYVNAATTDDIMAHLGATTKGGEVNEESCYGYCLELFIPWEYMTHLGLDAQAMKNSFIYVDPAHITSFNLTGTDTSVDRFWYYFAQQQGAGFSDVYQYFRFNEKGVMGTVPVTAEQTEHCSIAVDPCVIPGVQTRVTVTPESGYGLTSILVDGEEMIHQADFAQDGSVTLMVRSGTEGMTVSATAEAVSSGNKTLKGTVKIQKPGGDTLKGVSVFYNGPAGQKTVEMDASGHFTLQDLPQGYYTLTAEKEGYPTAVRSIYLNRDVETVLNLEYDTFFAEKGTCWVLDRQNEGILSKFGGSGYLLTNGSYNSFTFSANFAYDQELAKEAETDFFSQQRSGMRILFSNGKYWHIDLLKENGKYIVQYAKHSGDGSVFGWKGICEMNDAQIAKYCSEEGIKLTVVRQGQYAGVWLDGTLLAIEKLADEYAGCTAQLGFESWIANRKIMQIPYSISNGASVDVANAAFQKGGKWDVSGMFDSLLTNPGTTADTGWLNTYDEKYREISLTVSDKTPNAKNFKAAVHFEFSNGETFRIGLTNADTGELGVYKIQVLEANSIIKNWGTKYRLDSDQIAKLQSKDGIGFRVVVVGSQANVYLDNVQVCSMDLSKDTEGNATNIADKNAKIGVRIYGNEGVDTDVPFVLGGAPNASQIKQTESSQAVIRGSNHIIGETVVIKPLDEGCEFVSLKLDGKQVQLTEKDSYSFTATEKTHTVEAVSQRVRDWSNQNKEWDVSKQTQGVLTVPTTDGDSGWVQTYSSDYQDVDLQLTLRDQNTNDGNYRAAVRFAFSNGEYVTFTLTNAKATDDAATVYELQNMGGSILNWYQVKGFRLSDTQVQKLQSAQGLTMRVVRKGHLVDIYVDGQHAYEYDLSINQEGNASNVAAMPTNIQLRFYGNSGKNVTVPYTLKTHVQTVEVSIAASDKGAISANQKNYILGDTVILSDSGNSAWYCSGMKVNGSAVEPDSKGCCSFTAEKNTYLVEGVYSERIFKNSAEWNGIAQNSGLLTIPASDGDSGWIETYSDGYQALDLQLNLKDMHNAEGNYRAAVALTFSNDVNAIFTITNAASNDDATTVYGLQTMPSSFHKWGTYYTLTQQQSEKLHSQEGVQLRIVRVGTDVVVYLDGQYACKFDLTTTKEGQPSEIADLTAKVQLRFYGNKGENVEVPFVLNKEAKLVDVSITPCANGIVTADKNIYLAGDTVTLQVKGSNGYAYSDLQVNGTSVTADAQGRYSFVAQEDSYQVNATFQKGVFMDFANNAWILVNQNKGMLHISSNSNGAGWMQTQENYNELTLHVKDYSAGTVNEYAVVGQLYFSNGKYISVRLIYNKGSDTYTLQSMGDSVANWATHYTLNAQQYAKVQGDGIKFTMRRMGTNCHLYLDDQLVKTVDLTGRSSGITADMTCVAKVRYYNNKGYDVTLPFALDNPGQTGTVTVKPAENGIITADRSTYTMGQTVTLTVQGNEGYFHKGIEINGKTVTPEADGTYSFVANEESYTVSTEFAPGVFKDYQDNAWNLINQNQGVLHISKDDNGAYWLEAQGNRNELTLQVKDYAAGAVNEYAVVGQLYFSNGKYISIRLIYNKSNDTYTLQSMGDSVANWATHYTLNAQQYAKVQGDGIKFTMRRMGTNCHLYLDDQLVKTVDLTGRGSGITADMTCVTKVRYYNNKGYDVALPYVLGEVQN